MAFPDIKPVQKLDVYVETALYRGRKAAELAKQSKGSASRLERIRQPELKRLEAAHEYFQEGLFIPVVTKFPNIEELDDFYRELIKITVDYPFLKKSLGAVNWAWKQESELYRVYSKKIRSARDGNDIIKSRKAYIGRVLSVLKQVKQPLNYIEESRKVMRDFPVLKEVKTICIAGFPNVGKSTLLSRLTSAKPEIDEYAFTTKQLNLGYVYSDTRKRDPTLQLIDTPGTLNRLDKMNMIEKQAYLAMKYLAEKIIYVFDLTEEYPLEEQLKLYAVIRKLDKEILIYASKADIVGQQDIDDFAKENGLKILALEDLKGKLTEVSS